VSGRICVYGLWHLGCVTAACLAEQGFDVVGLELDTDIVEELLLGRPPIAEPGLAELITSGVRSGKLTFTSEPEAALTGADVVWVTFDTPVDDADRADVAWVRGQLEHVRPWLQTHTLVVVSSQVPVGFSSALRAEWMQSDPTLSFVSAPENLRLGRALESFRAADRVVLGASSEVDRGRAKTLFGPLQERIVWMSLESAEMTKHALNAFLATSVAYTNEVARICETVGADAAEVEQGLRSEPRVGAMAYISAGPALAGGTLMRDVRYLNDLAIEHALTSPLLDGVRASNQAHMDWTRSRLWELINGVCEPHVALLGLTYKVGTNTLQRSSALELAYWLHGIGATVAAYDPAIQVLPPEITWVRLAGGIDEALQGADALVLATLWPEFASLDPDQLVRTMRHPQVVDQTGFLVHLGVDPRLSYVRVGSRRTQPMR